MGILGAQEFREGRARQIAGLAAVDRYTVRVTLTEAAIPFVSVLAVGHAKIVPRELVEEQGEAFGTQPVGTGPFRFVRWERGHEIVLAANPDYFDGPPKLARLVFRIFPGESADKVFAEFQAGALEDSPIPSQDYRQIIASQGYQYVRRPDLQPPPLRVSHPHQAARRPAGAPGPGPRHRPGGRRLGDLAGPLRVRQGYPAAGDPGLQSEAPGLRVRSRAGARAPGPGGLPGRAGAAPRSRSGRASARRRSSASTSGSARTSRRSGITAEFQYNPDWPSFAKAMSERKLPVFLRAWFADVPDPENFLAKLFHSRSPWNYMGYANPAVDALLESARAESDMARRVEVYRRAEELILEDAPLIPVWHHTYERLFQPYVKGVEVSGLGDSYIPFRKVWLERPR